MLLCRWCCGGAVVFQSRCCSSRGGMALSTWKIDPRACPPGDEVNCIGLQRSLRATTLTPGAFQLYDINQDGYITYDEMLQIVRSIYKMTGQMVRLPEDEDTPEKVSQVRSSEKGSRVDELLGRYSGHPRSFRIIKQTFTVQIVAGLALTSLNRNLHSGTPSTSPSSLSPPVDQRHPTPSPISVSAFMLRDHS